MTIGSALGQSSMGAGAAESPPAGCVSGDPATYLDDSFFALEQERIFGRSWQYAGLGTQIPSPGDHFLCHLGAIPAIVIRGRDGGVNAFVNICRHRGHEIVTDPCVSRLSLQCRYHGWTYDLDGSLRTARRSDQIPGFDRSELGLFPIKVETWGALIFLNPDLEATPFAATFGEWQELVLATGVDIDSLTPHETRDYLIDANWKVWIENGLECYHCAICHPGFASLMDVNEEVSFKEYKHFSTFESKPRTDAIRDRQQTGDTSPYFDSAAESDDALWSWLWPNLFFSIFPGGGAMIAPARPDPTDPARCVYARQYCFPETTDEAVRRDFVEFFDQVTFEDQSVCASVQRGFTTGYYRQGPLLLQSEPGIIHFQRLLDQKLGA